MSTSPAAAWRDRRTHPGPLELWEVLAEEYEQGVEERKAKLPDEFDIVATRAVFAKAAYDAKPSQDACDAWNQARAAAEHSLFKVFHNNPRTALCFSGGGVRSATFGLGVLQGLARCGPMLSEFDFLSTVSGGGYIGGWFSAWAKQPGWSPAQVATKLSAAPSFTLDGEAPELQHIRKYCAFLNPKLGVLSADTWTLAATVIRNMILNWMVLIPILMAVVLLPDLYESFLPSECHWGGADFAAAMLGLGFISGVTGAAYVLSQLPKFSGGRQETETDYVRYGLLPLVIASFALTIHWAWRIHLAKANYTWLDFASFGAAMHFCGAVIAALVSWRKSTSPHRAQHIAFGFSSAIASGFATGLMTHAISRGFENDFVKSHDTYVCFAIPLVLLAFCIAALITVGLLSKHTEDSDREWWSRAGAWLMIVSVGWLLAGVALVFGPKLLQDIPHFVGTLTGTLTLGSVASWLGYIPKTTGGAGEEDKTNPSKGNNLVDKLAQAAGFLFLLTLGALLAIMNDAIAKQLPAWCPGCPFVQSKTGSILTLLGMLLLIGYIISRFVNVNRFSLHSMYRNRLIRTYLGASNRNREKDVIPFIDMADSDNFPMSELSTHRPLHIVNMALNLVAGKNLAWQQRKAESFTSSRLRTGSLRVGYQSSVTYGGRKGISMGSAVAISGAAASPNMGYHSSPLLSFVMTLFNARLGWWLANPGPSGQNAWTKDGPIVSFKPIIDEALGRTNDTGKWIYLSDGGHFENLGLYEMVLRRCRTILAVDGSQDIPYQFEDLANAARKIRVDLGIPIEFESGNLAIAKGRDPQNRYCGVAKIRYSAVDPDAPDGTLIYLKACLNETEPADVRNYASVEPEFPQQGTEQLWFNESQFESYRALGFHIVERIAGKTKGAVSTLDEFVQKVRFYLWSPTP